MSVDDLVYSLYGSEQYEFKINDIIYNKPGDIPPTLLGRNVQNWKVTDTPFANLFCLSIDTWDFVKAKVASRIMEAGFSMEQVKSMLNNGTSLSTITDMALSIDAVITAYEKMGYTKHTVRHIVYEIYANELLEDLNNIIIGINKKGEYV